MNIQHLIEVARETMLTSGNIMPMVHLELKSDDPEKEDINVIMALDLFSDAQSTPIQGGIIARAGWEECKNHPGYKPTFAGMYAEAWTIKEPDNDEQKLRPKLSDKRQEVIMVEAWHAEGNKRESYRMSVIRDHNKRVVDIGALEGPKNEVSMIFASFLQGVHDAQRPDEEVFSRMEGMIAKRIANLSPERRQELRDFAKSEGIPDEFLNGLTGGIS